MLGSDFRFESMCKLLDHMIKTGYQKNRQLLHMANLQQFLAVFCQLHKYLLQNLGSYGHLEEVNMLKSQLNQNL